MLKIYTNVVTKRNYDENGDLFENGHPRMFFKSKETVVWQLCTETPELDASQNPDTDWTKYTGYSAYTGVGAYLTADSDYRLKRLGSLVTAIDAGSVSSVVATIDGATYAMIPETGVLTLFTSTGDSETLSYTARSITTSNSRVTFTIEEGSTVTNSYAVNAEMDCNEAFYMQAEMKGTLSNPAEGTFGFEITAFSEKLRRSIVYSDVKELNISGLELAVFSVSGEDDTVQDLERYMVETFAIRSGLADLSLDVPVTTAQESAIAATINALLASGMELQFSSDGTSWHSSQSVGTDTYFRFRLAGGGGNWSAAVQVVNGQDGADGQDGQTPDLQIGTVTTLSAGASATASVTGSAPNFSLNLGIPRGSDGEAGPGAVTWGGISGTLSSQTDLNSALSAKADASAIGSGNLNIITSGGTVTFNANQSANSSVTLPTVNDYTVTIKQGGVSKGSFSLNQASSAIVDLDAGGSGGGGSVTWGGISGTLSSQTDLQSALNSKQDVIDSDNKLPYSNISGTPTIGSGTLTITSGGSTWTFDANQTSGTTIDLGSGGGGGGGQPSATVYDMGSSSGNIFLVWSNGDYQRLRCTSDIVVSMLYSDRPPAGCGMLLEVMNSGYEVTAFGSTIISSGTSGTYLLGVFAPNNGSVNIYKTAPEIFTQYYD